MLTALPPSLPPVVRARYVVACEQVMKIVFDAEGELLPLPLVAITEQPTDVPQSAAAST